MLSFFLLLLFELVTAEWVAIPGPKQYANYLAVTWPAQGSVIAAGYQVSGGNIITSSDYGVTWTAVNTTDQSTFGSLYGLYSQRVSGVSYNLAVDDSGQVFGSLGNGTSWSLYATVPTQLFGVTIGTNGYGFVCGYNNRIYRSSTASSFATWSSVGPTIGTIAQFNDISTFDGVNVIAVGSRGMVYYSSSSGALNSWTAGSSGISGVTAFIYCVMHATSSVAFAGGSAGYVAKTTDNGATWTRISIFASTVTIRFHAISTFQSVYVFIVGSNGAIHWSSDTGSTFSLLTSTGTTLYSIAMYDLTYGVAGAVAGTGVFTLVSSKYFLQYFFLFVRISFSR
jgi:photosystem II stability/assembly factor-like uncharacterized protein